MSNPNAPTSDYRALLILVGATALMAVVHLLPTPAPIERGGELIALTAEGKTCLAILLFAVTLWVGEAMPFAVTSLLVVILIAAFGITDFASAVNAGFGNPLIVFFIGVLFLSTGFTFSGLGTRMVLHVLRWAGTRADRVLLGFLIVGALLSMWITDMAVAAVMLPPRGRGAEGRRPQAAPEQLRPGPDDLVRLRPPSSGASAPPPAPPPTCWRSVTWRRSPGCPSRSGSGWCSGSPPPS